MDHRFSFLLIAYGFAAGLLFLAWAHVRTRALRLGNRQLAARLQGVCFISKVDTEKDKSLHIAFKNNTGKYWTRVEPSHRDAYLLRSAQGKFVAVQLLDELSATVAGNLRFELVYEHVDALETLLKVTEEALKQAEAEWPLIGGNPYEQLITALCTVALPLDQERVLRALVSWEGRYKAIPALVRVCAQAQTAIKRQKVVSRVLRAKAA